jgi:lysophospholipase L1-like esterase
MIYYGMLCAFMTCAAFSASSTGTNRVTVVNKGFSGNNTRDALRRLDTSVLPLRPEHAVVYFGMNDAMNSGNLIPLDAYAANLRALVQRLQANGAKTVALVTLNPVIVPYVRARHPAHPQKDRLQEWLAAYDEAVRALASETKCPLVDLRAIVEQHGGATPSAACLIRCEQNGGGRDGVHLTPAAYTLLGQAVFETLKHRVAPGDTVVCFGDSLTFGARVTGAGTASGETYPAILQACFNRHFSEGKIP